MKKKIRVFAILLAVIMCFTTMPMAAFAAETEGNEIMPRLTIFNQSKQCNSAGSETYYFTTPYTGEYTVILQVRYTGSNNTQVGIVLQNMTGQEQVSFGTSSSASRNYNWSASQTFKVEVRHDADVTYTIMVYR